LFNINTTLGYPSDPVLQCNFKIVGADLVTAWTRTNWFQFQLTVGARVADLDLTQLSFNAARGGAGTPRGYAVYVTTPASTNELIQPATDINTARPVWSDQRIDLTGISSLQNLTAGQKITFTIPAYSPTTASSVEFDDVQVRGLVSKQIVITHVTAPNPEVTLRWTSTPGKSYSVDYSLDLQSWAPLATNLIGVAEATETTAQLNLTGNLQNAVLLQYRMGAAAPQVQDALNTAAGGPLTAGAGLNLFNFNYDNYDSAPVLTLNFNAPQPALAAALAANAWFTFTLTVGTEVADLDLTALTFNVARGGATTPRGYAVYVTTPTTPFGLVQPATDVSAQRPNWGNLQTINLAATASLQNLTAGQVVTFHIPVYAPEAVQSLEFDDLTVRGGVTPLTAPPYAGTARLFLRVRTP
jgi:hypothetical protein